MIMFEDFYLASKTQLVDADTCRIIDANTAQKYSENKYTVENFEPVSNILTKVWVCKKYMGYIGK